MRPVRCGLLLGLLWAAGCKQGQGERCQMNSDCASDELYCQLTGTTPAQGGTCELRNPQGVDQGTTVNDMAVPPDLTMPPDQ